VLVSKRNASPKGFPFSLEESGFGGAGDHDGFTVLLDAYYFQKKRFAGKALR
jgi:hypothetical protein